MLLNKSKMGKERLKNKESQKSSGESIPKVSEELLYNLDIGEIRDLREKIANFIRRKVVFESEMMKNIGARALKKKIYGIYNDGGFDIPKKDANRMISKIAEDFCDKRDDMTETEWEHYVKASKVAYLEDKSKEKKLNQEEKDFISEFWADAENDELISGEVVGNNENIYYDSMYDPEDDEADVTDFYEYLDDDGGETVKINGKVVKKFTSE